ncbi:hypothetical protein SISSUDRAFT_1040665 [Sistotremastrum suecicum HHB10207 ss-3]|uniref:Uncharacterized protein n=1 Tax=Sistotremastrum suecicum HHB10207 ss-3 TaxID=1314776 RepID=A0A166HYN7_9AGAM|nr:hypothetical protein SISSUDRAFT_1040665 [Sistotremastrum suecicum HHB10207 ss-3]
MTFNTATKSGRVSSSVRSNEPSSEFSVKETSTVAFVQYPFLDQQAPRYFVSSLSRQSGVAPSRLPFLSRCHRFEKQVPGSESSSDDSFSTISSYSAPPPSYKWSFQPWLRGFYARREVQASVPRSTPSEIDTGAVTANMPSQVIVAPHTLQPVSPIPAKSKIPQWWFFKVRRSTDNCIHQGSPKDQAFEPLGCTKVSDSRAGARYVMPPTMTPFKASYTLKR